MKMKYSENIYQDFFFGSSQRTGILKNIKPPHILPHILENVDFDPTANFWFSKMRPPTGKGRAENTIQSSYLPAILESQFFKPWLQNDVLT